MYFLINCVISEMVLSCVDGSVYARFFSTDVDRYGERSCVRPFGAVYITAGLDEVRAPGP